MAAASLRPNPRFSSKTQPFPTASSSSSAPYSFFSKYHFTTTSFKNLRATPIPSISITDHQKTPPVIRSSLNSVRPDYFPNRISDPNYVRIFDTTLRDGEQSPGATMTTKQKLDIARQLAKLGVDIIEAGFPASSEADLDAVQLIAKEIGNPKNNTSDGDVHVPVICGLARCNKRDIDKAWEAVKYARKPRIHTFIATSEIHMKHKLKKTKEEVVERARSMVAYARNLGCPDVEFSPEDAGRFLFSF